MSRLPMRMQATIAIEATPAVLAAVRAGAGLSADFLVRDELASGRLVHILPEWRPPSGGIYTVYPAARFRPPQGDEVCRDPGRGRAGEGLKLGGAGAVRVERGADGR
ncbi:LysR substrate-binding domain-containing protein, partial [Mesorhizobium sp. M6A.T.Ce.TU.002.03.1.1]|uniref:LysR substrate-binding domain-containing protein n=1 Tax=Mesorhizobium sp. M6A.T.Ce.TU.002.03.1.1 TaxID=2496782 RepID=UPI00247A0882